MPATLRERVDDLSRSDTGRAAGLGVAMIVSNVLALGFTIVFARVLGASGYGDLAVLLSSFIIMMVPGSALQIAAAREVSPRPRRGQPQRRGGRAQVAGSGSWSPPWPSQSSRSRFAR